MPSSCPCGCLAVFWEVSYGTALPYSCLPPRCASSALPLHGTSLVMSSFQSYRSSSRPTASHRPSPRPSTRRAGSVGACFLLRCLFVSARRDIIRTRFSSNRPSPRLLACPVASDCYGMRGFSCLSARLSIRPSVSFLPPRLIDTRNGTNGGAGLFPVIGAVIRSANPFDCVGMWDGGDCVSHLDVLDCLPVILRLPGNTSAGNTGRHGVGSLGRIRLLPRLFRIPYGFVSFRPFSAPSPRAVSSVPFLCLLHSHRPVNRLMLSPSINRERPAPCGFLALPLIANHAPPIVS